MARLAHIKGLNGIRGLAALTVVFTHLHGWVALERLGWLPPSAIPLLGGTAGVQAFFVLSGFLITRLLIEEYDVTGSISIRKFFWRRALRIFPLYFLFLLLATAIYMIDSRVTSLASLMYGYLYSYNFVPASVYTGFMGHTWSLAVEEHFYLLWPLLFIFFFPRRASWMLALLLASIPVSLMLHLWLVRKGVGATYFPDRWSFIAGYNISAGCALAILLNMFGPTSVLQRLLARRECLWVGGIVYCTPSLFFGQSWAFDSVLSHYFRCFGLTAFIGWIAINQSSKIVHLLEIRPLRYLGIISYGIYMYQGLLLATGPHRELGHLWPPPINAMTLFLLLVLPPLSYQYFEKPFIDRKRDFNSFAK